MRHVNAAERRAKVEARLAARSEKNAGVGVVPTDKDLFERMSYGRAVLAFPKTYAHQDTAAALTAARAAATEWRRRYPGRLPRVAKKWAKIAHGIALGLFAEGSNSMTAAGRLWGAPPSTAVLPTGALRS